MFLMNQDGLNNLGRGSPKEHFCQIILKLIQWFLTRSLLKFFSFGCYGNQNSAWIPNLLTIFNQYHPRIIPVKFNKNWRRGLGRNVKKKKLWMDGQMDDDGQ